MTSEIKKTFLNFYSLRRKVTNLLNESEHIYYKNTLHEAKSNSKKNVYNL